MKSCRRQLFLFPSAIFFVINVPGEPVRSLSSSMLRLYTLLFYPGQNPVGLGKLLYILT